MTKTEFEKNQHLMLKCWNVEMLININININIETECWKMLKFWCGQKQKISHYNLANSILWPSFLIRIVLSLSLNYCYHVYFAFLKIWLSKKSTFIVEMLKCWKMLKCWSTSTSTSTLKLKKIQHQHQHQHWNREKININININIEMLIFFELWLRWLL